MEVLCYAVLVQVNVRETLTINSVERWHPDVHVGGRWSPVNCTAWQKIAIIISYKDRYEQLILLLNRLHTLLKRQMMYYQIFVIEQVICLRFVVYVLHSVL